jgi:SAM-dependent methyltransferase
MRSIGRGSTARTSGLSRLASLPALSAKRRGLVIPLLLTACNTSPAAPTATQFPAAARPVASIVSPRWSDEDSRDKAGESVEVMDRAGVKPGMTVADIGAGEGYYTIRLAARLGPKGRVLAQDIVPEVRDALAERVTRERLDNVSVKLGTPDNAGLPENSFDRVFLVHMYHEIESPYAFLWHLRPATKAGGRVIVVDADRPTNQHGTPPALLKCEFAAVGYRQVDYQAMPSAGGYLAAFEPSGAPPAPDAIKACRL